MRNQRPGRSGVASIVAGLVLACAGCAPMPEYDVERTTLEGPGGTSGVRLRTDHFDMRVTAKDELLLDYLPPFMETTFAEYQRLVPAPAPPEERLIIYLFNTRDEWAGFTSRRFPAQAQTYLHIHAGGYTDYATATAVAFDLGRDRTLSLLAHEGMHQYFARFFPRPVPPWLNEGLACQFEAFDLKGPYPVFTPRRNFLRRNHLREALAVENGLIDMNRLLNMDAGEAIRRADESTRTYYAQVWSLVLYLREGGGDPDKPGFAALLADLGTQQLMDTLEAFRADHPELGQAGEGELLFRCYIADDLDAFMEDYRDFVLRLVG